MEDNNMKATGIVRRIDELGRVVVPKEIRRTLRIREGDPLEIFTNRDGEVILKKYSPIGELDNFAKQYAEALGQTSGQMIMICDRDQVVAASGGAKKENIGKKISKDVENLIDEREVFTTHNSLKKGDEWSSASGDGHPAGECWDRGNSGSSSYRGGRNRREQSADSV